MANITEAAQAYEAPQTKNVADLESVPADAPVETRVFKQGTPDEFSFNVVMYNNEDYRVPDSVLKSLKEILKAKQDLKTFKVTKTGQGINTSYTVIPLT